MGELVETHAEPESEGGKPPGEVGERGREAEEVCALCWPFMSRRRCSIGKKEGTWCRRGSSKSSSKSP